MQTSIVGFLQDDPLNLTLLAGNICIGAIVVLVFVFPYKKQSDNVFALLSLAILTLAVQYSMLETGTNDIFEASVDLILIAELLLFGIFALKDMYSLARAKDFF